MLKELATYLTQPTHNYEDAEDLWHIITALRGPDFGNVTCSCGKIGCPLSLSDTSMKRATTAVIRYHFHLASGLDPYAPTSSISMNRYGCDIRKDSAEHLEIRKYMDHLIHWSYRTDPSIYHYYQHVQQAFRALNLKWDAVNE